MNHPFWITLWHGITGACTTEVGRVASLLGGGEDCYGSTTAQIAGDRSRASFAEEFLIPNLFEIPHFPSIFFLKIPGTSPRRWGRWAYRRLTRLVRRLMLRPGACRVIAWKAPQPRAANCYFCRFAECCLCVVSAGKTNSLNLEGSYLVRCEHDKVLWQAGIWYQSQKETLKDKK